VVFSLVFAVVFVVLIAAEMPTAKATITAAAEGVGSRLSEGDSNTLAIPPQRTRTL
jgi:hypothetical protein